MEGETANQRRYKASTPMKPVSHFLLLAIMLTSPAVFPARAATNEVTTLADSGIGSLRSTISNSISGDVITFATSGTITLTLGELLITNNLTIIGPGATNLIISGNNLQRIFNFAAGTTNSISGLSINNGQATNGINGNSGGSGGGIYNQGTLYLTACVFNGNRAGAGGRSTVSAGTGGAGGTGGAIYNLGSIALTNCNLMNNLAGKGGAGGSATGSDIAGGTGGVGGAGGAISSSGSISLTGCTFSGNLGGNGGSGGAGSPTSSSFVGSGTGGAGGAGGAGGGIYNSGSISLTECTLGGNSVGNGGGGGTGGSGLGSLTSGGNGGRGGIAGGGGAIYSSGSLSLISCTISGNTAANGGSGGAGGAETGGGFPGGDGFDGVGGVGGGIFGTNCTLRSTLVAVNNANPTNGPDISGVITSRGHNLIGNADGSSGITNGVNADLAGNTASPLNPRLGSLGDYGGGILTMALLPGSPAVDAGDDAVLNAPFNLATDQRGNPYSRKIGAHVDIGAFELLPGDENYDGAVDINELTSVLAVYNNGVADQNALSAVLARLNGNGIVNQAEWNLVYSNYLSNSPFLLMTNVAGLGGTNVTFQLTNSIAGNYTVQYSTNLLTWFNLGPAVPQYIFTDTNVLGQNQRFYRLTWP